MGWTKITAPPPVFLEARKVTVTVKRWTPRGRPKLVVSMRREFAEGLGLAHGARVAGDYGTAKDAGLLRLALAPDGAFRVVHKSKSGKGAHSRLYLMLPPPAGCPLERLAAAVVAVADAAQGLLVLRLPEAVTPTREALVRDAVAQGKVTRCPPAGSGALPHYDDTHSLQWGSGRRTAGKGG